MLAANACVRVIVPRTTAFPVRVPVIVIVFDPVNILPWVMVRLVVFTLLFKVTVVVAVLLLSLKTLKVVTPVVVVFSVPLKVIVLVDGVNVP